MKKIKVMKFLVSNPASRPLGDDVKEDWYKYKLSQLHTEEYIEHKLNDFFKKYPSASIVSVNKVDVNYHNNGRGNTIELWYTIQYAE